MTLVEAAIITCTPLQPAATILAPLAWKHLHFTDLPPPYPLSLQPSPVTVRSPPPARQDWAS